jgi:hypothetical protein
MKKKKNIGAYFQSLGGKEKNEKRPRIYRDSRDKRLWRVVISIVLTGNLHNSSNHPPEFSFTDFILGGPAGTPWTSPKNPSSEDPRISPHFGERQVSKKDGPFSNCNG